MKRIAILGSTGSIGRSTLSVAESYPDRFQIVTLAAGSNLDAAFEQAQRWRPSVISMATERDAEALRDRLKKEGLSQIEVVHGTAGTVRVATQPEVDFVVSAIVGSPASRLLTKRCEQAKLWDSPTRSAWLRLGS